MTQLQETQVKPSPGVKVTKILQLHSSGLTETLRFLEKLKWTPIWMSHPTTDGFDEYM